MIKLEGQKWEAWNLLQRNPAAIPILDRLHSLDSHCPIEPSYLTIAPKHGHEPRGRLHNLNYRASFEKLNALKANSIKLARSQTHSHHRTLTETPSAHLS